MILILIAIIATIVLAMVMILHSDTFFSDVICPMVVALGFGSLFIYSIFVFNYMAAGTKAEVLNREFGTSYTQQEIFFASDVIDTVRELKRERIEINGDILKKGGEL